jgi:hypothetical protein
MNLDQIATKGCVDAAEERLKSLLMREFEALRSELIAQNKRSEELYLTKREAMKKVGLKSQTTFDKWEKRGKFISEDWGDGGKRSPRYPLSQFDKRIEHCAQDSHLNLTG